MSFVRIGVGSGFIANIGACINSHNSFRSNFDIHVLKETTEELNFLTTDLPLKTFSIENFSSTVAVFFSPIHFARITTSARIKL